MKAGVPSPTQAPIIIYSLIGLLKLRSTSQKKAQRKLIPVHVDN
jgi:hypothetical protein